MLFFSAKKNRLDEAEKNLYNFARQQVDGFLKREVACMTKYEKFSLIIQALGTAALIFEVFFK